MLFAAALVAAAAAGDAFTNDLPYLKRKWRASVTDEGTGLGTDGVLAGWKEIVAARGDEPWEVTKAKIFAFGCDRTAIGVSPHDWFPAFAPWSFHRGHPLWKILPQRANEVDARRSPGLAKKIGLYFWDHNKERTLERARALLGDPAAAARVAGIAVHWYSGDHFEQLRMFKERWPEKDVLFSECCCSIHEGTDADPWRQGEMYAHDIAGNLENGMTRWIDWNVLLDAKGGPNHVGNFCDAPLRTDAACRRLLVRPSWHYIAHFSRFLRPGAVRVGCSRWTSAVEAVAARNADGSFAAVLLNRTDRALRPQLRFRGLLAPVELPAHSIATCTWK